MHPAEEFAFGKPNRPSTPINGVISNFYGDSAANEIEGKYQLQYELVSIDERFELFGHCN